MSVLLELQRRADAGTLGAQSLRVIVNLIADGESDLALHVDLGWSEGALPGDIGHAGETGKLLGLIEVRGYDRRVDLLLVCDHAFGCERIVDLERAQRLSVERVDDFSGLLGSSELRCPRGR